MTKKIMAEKKLHFTIPLVIYPMDILISFGETDDELRNVLYDYGLSKDDIDDAMFVDTNEDGRAVMFTSHQSLIRLRNYPVHPFHYGCLSHEVFHVVTFIMDRIGIQLKIRKSDEAYAYLTGYVTTKIFEKLKWK